MTHRLSLRTLATLRSLPRGARTISSVSHRPEKAGPLYEQASAELHTQARTIATAAHKPDTGGPLFDAPQTGAELHRPSKGGDGERAAKHRAEKGQANKGKEEESKKKSSADGSFARLKMLRNVSVACGSVLTLKEGKD